MKRRQWFYLVGVLVGATLLAFLLRDVVQGYVILPLARLIWNLRILYRTIPQVVYWVLVLVFAVSIAISSITFHFQRTRKSRQADYLRYGDVRQLAFWIRRGRRGVYSKWHVARSLADLALEVLPGRKEGLKRGQQLEGPGWNPPAEVQAYLEAALKTTYADYPRRHLFDFSPPTPFDRGLEATVAYLESLVEKDDDHRHS